ncbi:MAG: WecB/TagA/CpsF family glycosyltransferase [Burkholderiales bacterium]|nr:WecB/TagA/CpsF family glycosyltransferase [Burkholderiales bacterium]
MSETAKHDSVTQLFGLEIQNSDFAHASQNLLAIAKQRGQTSRIVVTPNVDHLVRLEQQPEFKALYRTADFIFADGMPVVWASKMTDHPLPERVTGADLFVSLCQDCVTHHLSIFIVGGMPGQEDMLRQAFSTTYPGLKTSIFCPSMQFTPDGPEADEAMQRIQTAQPNIVFICLGMPKQEHFALRYRREQTSNNAPLLLCVGAAMEFALGQKQRAPLWMQKVGLEWFWRLASEPRRLWRRYTTQASKFIGIVYREYRSRRR